MLNAPCPVCAAPHGFHDRGPHTEAATGIHTGLLRPSNNHRRQEQHPPWWYQLLYDDDGEPFPQMRAVKNVPTRGLL